MTTADQIRAWTAANRTARAAYHDLTVCSKCSGPKEPNSDRRACDKCTRHLTRKKDR